MRLVQSDDEFWELMCRGRGGFQAFVATIDLLGMQAMMLKRPSEARARIDDLQQSFGGVLPLYPGGESYRVCFAGDSLFVVREIEPDADAPALWASFCGHVFALSCFLHTMERQIGNPGLRLIIASGPLFQVRAPRSWQRLPWSSQTRNWFVLTGATAALKKCWDAEARGRKGGFLGGYCWHERPEVPGSFLGTRLRELPPDTYMRPDLYPAFYTRMAAEAEGEADLGTSDSG